jgi:hypothetical protein
MADTKISALTAADAAADANQFAINEAGTSKRVTLAQMETQMMASPTMTGTVTLPTGLTGVIRADSGVVSVDTDVTDIVAAASDTVAGKIEIAIQSEMETGTDTARAVVPGRQHFHPSACKGWGKAAGSGSLTVGYNMDAVTDTGTGRLGVNITTDISSANYAIVSSVASVATTLTVATVDNGGLIYKDSQAAGTFGIWDYDDTATTHVAQDPQSYFWAIFGDFA